MKNMELGSSHMTQLTEVKYCEICPGRARFEVLFNAGPLYFCGHHFSKEKHHFENVMLQVQEIQENY